MTPALMTISTLTISCVVDRIENPLVGTTIVGAVNVLATYAVLFLMDRCGRRTLILWSTAGMFFSSVVIVATLLGAFEKLGT